MIILQGSPCAGKTTHARALAAGKTDVVVVSRDDIRHALGDYWVPRREPLVDHIETSAIVQALMTDYTVVVDSMNLDPARVKMLESLATQCDAAVSFEQLYVPYRQAVRRDRNPDRPHNVGEENIRKIYEKFFPDRLRAELESPEEPLMEDDPAEPGAPRRFPMPSDLDNIRKLASLQYKPSDICAAIEADPATFKMHLADHGSAVYKAYRTGQVEAEIDYRMKVKTLAGQGEEWAIKMMARWGKEQSKEEKTYSLG